MSISSDFMRSLFSSDSQHPERTQTVAAATTAIGDSLLRCLVWLLHHGVSVVKFEGYSTAGGDQFRIVCVASPKLHALFSGQCEIVGRWDFGNGARRIWVAQAFGVRVEWEEASC